MAVVLSGAMLLLASVAHADQTVSVGYAQGKVADGDTLNGANIKYNYEWDNHWGVVGSATYMKGSESNAAESLPSIAPDKWGNAHRDTKYYSIMAGPSYRFNDMVKVYGLTGFTHSKADAHADWMNHESGQYVKRGEVSASTSTSAMGFGLGVQINPVKNVAIDIGYEGTRATNAVEDKNMNAFNIGVGYRF